MTGICDWCENYDSLVRCPKCTKRYRDNGIDKEKERFADWIKWFIKGIKDIKADDVSEENKFNIILDLAEAKVKELRSEGK